ncbi:MAG: tetratricopeptide repeat protein [Xanthobacteraceae bacterium]|nr:tetratricopeptide repeat protein [Xanthobacteraceae bacterium]
MRLTPSILIAAVALGAGFSGPTGAQTPPGAPLVQPPAHVPQPRRGDYAGNLEFLLGALKVAPDETSAKAIEDRIWALWQASGSDTVDLLMTRVKQASDAGNYDLALRLLDAIIEIRPEFVEAWNRRATIFFLKKDYSDSLSDIEHVLTKEPRHFGALAGLGTILEEVGDDKHALEAYRKALAVHPHLKGVAEHVKALTDKVEGRDI